MKTTLNRIYSVHSGNLLSTHLRPTHVLVHHFTIIQHKHLFVNEECEAFWVNEGLNPSEAEDLALIPVIAMTLNVPGLDMYHQRFFKHDDKISLTNFFYEAWSSSPFLKGVPDQLCIDRELLNAVPLVDILKQIDPQGKIKSIVSDTSRTFAASKRQAHNQPVIYWEEYERETKPTSIIDLLMLIGEKTCQRQLSVASASHAKSKMLSFQQHWAISNYPPTIPLTPDAYFRFDTNWVTKQSMQVPVPDIGQAYFYSEENDDQRWIHWLYLLEDNVKPQLEDRNSFQDDLEENSSYWPSKVAGLVSTINTLAYPIGTVLPGKRLRDEVDNFIRGGGSLSSHRMLELLKTIDAVPIILFPKTVTECKAAFKHISRGDCKSVFELVSKKHSSYIFRVFACNASTTGVFLIAIKSDCKANSPALKEAFYCTVNQLDIGPPGFSALSYWIELVAELKIKDICGLVINMVERMLRVAIDGRKTLP